MTEPIVRLRLLLVDDDEALLNSVRRLLAPRCDVHAVGGAKAALAALAVDSFDAVVTDLEMPGHNGLWLLMRVREQWPRVVRVMVSGGAPVSVQEHVRSGLVQCLFAKPYDVDGLLACIAAALASRGP